LPLGWVLDGDGFTFGSQVFPGNASEPGILKTLLEGLQGKNPIATPKPIIFLDTDIAIAANIVWLVEHHYHSQVQQEIQTMK